MSNFIEFTGKLFVLLCLAFVAVYSPRLRAWFGALTPQKKLVNHKKNKIALIIPAKNESKVIETLLKSCQNQTYDKDCFDIHVIVSDKKDKTLDILKKYNAIPHIIAKQKCKGDALDGCLKNIMKTKPDYYDAYLVIDADCLLKDDFIEQMNNSMASGAKVILSKKLVKNYLSKSKSTVPLSACCNGLIWTIIDDMGNRYKADHGLTIMTIGTGLLLRADFIKELGGWPYRHTMTEDMELMNDCALRKVPTFYYSYAVLYMEEAIKLSETNKRRTRWLTGLVASEKMYRKALKKSTHTYKDKVNRYFVTALRPVFKFIGMCTCFTMFHAFLALFLFLFKNALYKKALACAVLGFGTIYGSFFILSLFCIIIDYKHIHLSTFKKVALCFIHPFFYMGYIKIIANALLGKEEQWDAIERVDMEDVTAIGV